MGSHSKFLNNKILSKWQKINFFVFIQNKEASRLIKGFWCSLNSFLLKFTSNLKHILSNLWEELNLKHLLLITELLHDFRMGLKSTNMLMLTKIGLERTGEREVEKPKTKKQRNKEIKSQKEQRSSKVIWNKNIHQRKKKKTGKIRKNKVNLNKKECVAIKTRIERIPWLSTLFFFFLKSKFPKRVLIITFWQKERRCKVSQLVSPLQSQIYFLFWFEIVSISGFLLFFFNIFPWFFKRRVILDWQSLISCYL